MKRAILLAGSLALAATPVALLTPAQAKPQLWILDFCRDVVLPEFNYIPSLGECVAYNQTLFNSEDHGFPTLDCYAYREFEPEVFYEEYDTFGECVIDNV